jgi:hypothetical protein
MEGLNMIKNNNGNTNILTPKYINFSVIKERFETFNDYKMWVVCSAEKVPLNPKNGHNLKWSDTDLYMTLPELEKWIDFYPGFGLFTGISQIDSKGKPFPSVRCFDFDDVLENGEPKHPKLDDFLERLNTFVEVSSSGKGLHAFITTDAEISEFGFDENKWWSGKFYTGNRFIKLTGNVYKNDCRDLNNIKKIDLLAVKERLGIREPITFPTYTPPVANTQSWDKILTDAGIEHTPTSYTGKEKDGKICLESWKIECPNKINHKHDRPGDPSAHKAILLKTDDGLSTVKCNHNSCKAGAEYHPQLLKKLWDQIFEKRTEGILQKLGWL